MINIDHEIHLINDLGDVITQMGED